MSANDGASSRGALAERDALLEVVAIFAHDLSNPLQSITVLCELGIDDAVPGSDDQQRAQQCLEAADRMRGLIHSFAGLLRSTSAATPVRAVVERVTTLFARRFERHRIETTVDVDAIAETRCAPGLEFVMLNLLLGAVATAADCGKPSYAIEISGSAGEDHHCVALKMTAADEPIVLSDDHVGRARDIIESAGGNVKADAGRVEVSFPAQG